MGEEKRGNGVLTWRVVAGVLALGAASIIGWAGQTVVGVKAEQDRSGPVVAQLAQRTQELETRREAERKEQTTQQQDVAVIKEKVNRLETDVKEMKQDVRAQNQKLDELLRRTR